METGSVVATPDRTGVTVRLGCHHPYGERQHLAQALDLPEALVRVIETPQGGAFGGKDDNLVSIFTALLARATGRPVRLFYSRIDSMEGHSKRHPQRIHVKTGARRDGQLTACGWTCWLTWGHTGLERRRHQLRFHQCLWSL
jgi:CO/xanthine dehydrogenase Mo-binding subunit